MKITLDLTHLVETGQLTAAEAERLRLLASQDMGTLGLNILVAFGVVAVAAGVGALIPSALTAVVLGAVLLAAGFGLLRGRHDAWALLAQICLVVGVLALAGGLAYLDEGSLRVLLLDAVLLAVVGSLARSGLLIALAVLTIGTCLGSSTDYRHALYSLSVEQPALTIVVFSGIALAAYVLSLRVSAAYERLALIAARTALLMVNLAFWVGSLWGDDLAGLRRSFGGAGPEGGRMPVISDVAFGVIWAALLLAVGIWAVRANRRWVVNTVAVFAAIHFYTQWFERLGANPLTILLAGLLMLAFALGIRAFNRRRWPRRTV